MKKNQKKMKKYKLGKDQKTGQEHARIWLQNKRLSEVGFTPGSYYATEWCKPPLLKLWSLNYDDITAEARKVTDKKGTSVIDLTGWEIKQFFEGYTHYTVRYEGNCLTIRGANE
jgi:hypothetical protein